MENDIPDHVAVVVKIIRAVKKNVLHEEVFYFPADIIIACARERWEIGRVWRPTQSDTIH
jgi:hypothetical protein